MELLETDIGYYVAVGDDIIAYLEQENMRYWNMFYNGTQVEIFISEEDPMNENFIKEVEVWISKYGVAS